MSRPLNLLRVALLLCLVGTALTGCVKKDIARVGTVPITRAQFLAQLEKDYGHEVLNRLIDREVVNQTFTKAGLTFPQEKLEAEIQKAREQAGSEEAFQQWLAMQGRSEEDLRVAIEMGMKLEMIAQKDIKFTEKDLRAYYKENELRYDLPLRVNFSDIVLPSEKEAQDVYEMAIKPNASFSDLAKQYSIGPNRANGGRRPTMVEEQIIPVELRHVVLTIPVNKVSRPIKSASGDWYIVLVHERLPAEKQTFEKAREAVEIDYKREKMVNPAELIQQLRSQAKVRIIDDRYADLQRLYMGADVLGAAPTGEEVGASAPATQETTPTAPKKTTSKTQPQQQPPAASKGAQ